MYIRTIGLKRSCVACGFAVLAACSTKARPTAPRPNVGHNASLTVAPAPKTLCDSRQGCAIIRERSTPALGELRVVDLAIARTDAAQGCKRREYWLTGVNDPVLLAADCEEQWGADEAGPADTQIVGSRLQVRYVEFQADDSCVVVDAEVDLKPVRILKLGRKRGRVAAEKCIAGEVRSESPVGDGSLNRPLLMLHVD